jgi:hypothetical protein
MYSINQIKLNNNIIKKKQTEISVQYSDFIFSRFIMSINWVSKIKLISALILTILLINCGNKQSASSPENGDLTNTFIVNDSIIELSPAQIFQKEKDKLIADGWEDRNIPNGQLPSCYNFISQFGSVNNYLEVKVGSNTDVVIKVMNLENNSCIRYVFINSGTTYQLKNIPEGQYYLKIAYGENWFSKVENEQCIGKFISNPMYEKGEDILDFRIQHSNDGYSVPSFRLELDVIKSNISNSFNSQNISEDEFNK